MREMRVRFFIMMAFAVAFAAVAVLLTIPHNRRGAVHAIGEISHSVTEVMRDGTHLHHTGGERADDLSRVERYFRTGGVPHLYGKK